MLDSPAEPQNLRCEIELNRPVDETRLRAAARAVATAEPRARVRLRRWRFADRGFVWEVQDELDDDPVAYVEVDDPASVADVRDELVGRPFNLDRSPAWRL